MAVSISRASTRHRPRRRSGGQAFTDINVTPFVDVMLVLLVIFMVTAPMLTVGVPVDLPKTKAAKMNDQAEPLVVTVDAEGKSYLSETELEGDALIERLIAVSGSNPDAKIYVRGDQKINYGRVMEIMGIISAAGFSKVSLIAEMPSGPDKGKNLKVTSQPTLGPAALGTPPLGSSTFGNAAASSASSATQVGQQQGFASQAGHQALPTLNVSSSIPPQGIKTLPINKRSNSVSNRANGPTAKRSQ